MRLSQNFPRLTSNLENIAAEIRQEFSAKDAAREKGLRLCREVIRCSSRVIRAVHRHEKEEAEQMLNSTRILVNEVTEALAQYPDLLHGGFVHNAQKEFAEASITWALLNSIPLPTPESLGVDSPAYLNGLGEAAGELRRYLLDSMRGGDFSRGEELLAMIDDVYGVLVTIDFPDALTEGLRRTTDMVRGVLEKSRGDLTMALVMAKNNYGGCIDKPSPL